MSQLVLGGMAKGHELLLHRGIESRTLPLYYYTLGGNHCCTIIAYNYVHVVSGHHSNTFLSISSNQRHQSEFYKYKIINFSHSTCSHKNSPLKWSVVTGTFLLRAYAQRVKQSVLYYTKNRRILRSRHWASCKRNGSVDFSEKKWASVSSGTAYKLHK